MVRTFFPDEIAAGTTGVGPPRREIPRSETRGNAPNLSPRPQRVSMRLFLGSLRIRSSETSQTSRKLTLCTNLRLGDGQHEGRSVPAHPPRWPAAGEQRLAAWTSFLSIMFPG